MTTLHLPKKVDIAELTDVIKASAAETGFRYTECNGQVYVSKELPDSLGKNRIATSHTFYLYLIGISSKKEIEDIECMGQAQLNDSSEKLNMPYNIGLRYSSRYRDNYREFAGKVRARLTAAKFESSFAEKDD